MEAGSTLFHRGDPSFGLFFLASGRLRLQRITPDGNATTVHAPRPGELFAEASLFAEHYHCDAVAETDCDVWIYAKDAMQRHLRRHSDALWNYAATLARSLQGMRQRYELKQIRSAPERVLQALLLRCDDSGGYRSPGPLREMAADLGLTHETFYRALAALERDGRITRDDRMLCVTGLRPATGRMRRSHK